MPRTHHAVIVLPLTAILGGCGSEVPLDNQGGNGANQGEALLPEQPALADPCVSATGPGTYKGYTCGNSSNFITTTGISCQEARRKCTLKAAANPETSFYCTWNDRLVYRKETAAGACNPLVCQVTTGTGTYRGYICGSHNFITTNNISCQYALDNCALNAANNPSRSFFCTWNDIEVFRKEQVPGICNGLP
ncbi:hypothetical protein [Archangium sp.]|uniref:hypothetical protein n=1 Tax=Archangium sp. TaxID=1872627 RepID=UPI002D3A248A|nr:hypothetical protein [Archangium sp.]HYO52476.1 hypothetical protein [Archangium sp.]